MSRIAFIQKEEDEMNIEAAHGHSVVEIVAGLNAGRYEIADDNETITDAITKAIVACVWSIEPTAAVVERGEFFWHDEQDHRPL